MGFAEFALILMGIILAGTIVVLTNLVGTVQEMRRTVGLLEGWAWGYGCNEHNAGEYSAEGYLRRLKPLSESPKGIKPSERLQIIERELGIKNYEQTPPSQWVAKKYP